MMGEHPAAESIVSTNESEDAMRSIAMGLLLSQIFCATVAFAQSSGGTGGTGGSAGSPGAASGGALGTSAGAPGTNSAGTAAPSGSGSGYGATGTGDPAVDKQDKELDRKIKSICKGC